MAEFFLMPKLGMDMEEGIISRWLKQEGDQVTKGELLAEIETDKAAVEVESSATGTILKLYYEADSGVACGNPIAYIGQPGDPIPEPITGAPQDEPNTETATAIVKDNTENFFLMPKLGMDMEEGIIARWLKAEGDNINKGELLVEIETDKAAVEVESPRSGVVLKLYYPEGTAKEFGHPIAYIGNPGESVPSAEAYTTIEASHLSKHEESIPSVSEDLFFCMPKLGMDMEEGTIVQWLKAEGDTVKKGEPLVEIETDKAAVVSEATVSGTVLKIFYGTNEAAPCGVPIAAIGTPGTIVPDPKSKSDPAPTAEPETDTLAETPVLSTIKHDACRVIASPRARRCAANNNVNLNDIVGTGENNRIVEEDVLGHIANNTNTVLKVRVPKDNIVPLTGVRKVVANRMRNSLQEMAQTNTRMDVDMTNIISFRKQINERLSTAGVKVSYVDLLVAVCAKALVENPLANASLEKDGIHYKNYANVGVAVDTPKGLYVPVIKDADILSISQISQKSKELINKAREGSLRPDDMKGGTFTISNLGMFEVDSFTAIVNPPETCILAVGRIAEKPVVVENQIVVRSMMNLCLSYDHRVIDGAPSARFLQCVKHYIENPVWLLM